MIQQTILKIDNIIHLHLQDNIHQVNDNVRSKTQEKVEQIINRETPKVQTRTVEVEQRNIQQYPRMQSQQILKTQTQGFVGGQSYVSNFGGIFQIGYQGNYQVQQNCVAT
ncbi:unnamed protein product [Paramecium sonneborni]|uniref:Uncharacterized protein n=1 Tax=Paramecium sonneborni TaxID=65129 RepID=A0A8S1N7Z9_9CILI|nr:unnamed protein product [Paramecium sonneborni]